MSRSIYVIRYAYNRECMVDFFTDKISSSKRFGGHWSLLEHFTQLPCPCTYIPQFILRLLNILPIPIGWGEPIFLAKQTVPFIIYSIYTFSVSSLTIFSIIYPSYRARGANVSICSVISPLPDLALPVVLSVWAKPFVLYLTNSCSSDSSWNNFLLKPPLTQSRASHVFSCIYKTIHSQGYYTTGWI